MTNPWFFKAKDFTAYQMGLLKNTNLGIVGFQELKHQQQFNPRIKPPGIPGHYQLDIPDYRKYKKEGGE